MKKVLGLDLGTNSIGWALVAQDFENKKGEILGLGSRIIPMSQDILGKFDAGQSHSQTAERTGYRGVRRLYHRDNLRRERLHRVLNILGFLPEHYKKQIDFDKRKGQFINNSEPKLPYFLNHNGKYEFMFKNSFNEMVDEFKKTQPHLFYIRTNGKETKIPYDWTIYYLRKKALNNKIEKEELAWLILNFNQKRGYYQLRGEDVDDKPNKKEEFYSLKIINVVSDEETNRKGETWYSMHLENGWIYRRSSKKSLSDWKNKTKDFIVTTEINDDGSIKLDKDGNEKRSFRAPKEDDWGLLKKKTEQDIEQSEKTVGEYIYESLLEDPTQKIRGKLVKTIERKFYRKELTRILKKQIELQPELFSNEKYLDSIKELYPLNESHRKSIEKKDFNYLFIEDIIFYQRPLKSQKSNIGGCQFEFRTFKKENKETGALETVRKSIQCIPKSHPLFQEFRLWQWLQNLKIYNKEIIENGKEKNITSELLTSDENWNELFDFLAYKANIEQKHVVDYFVKKGLLNKTDKEKYKWNYVEDKPYPSLETKISFINRLKKVTGLKNPEQFLSEKTLLGNSENASHQSRLEQLWHLIYSLNDANEFESGLKKFANKHSIDEASFLEAFIKHPPFSSDFASYSKKAINKLLPLMKNGKYWSKEDIHPQTLERIQKIIDGEFDEKIKDKVREKSMHLKNIEDFSGLPLWLASYVIYDRHAEIGDVQQWKTPQDLDKFISNFKQHSLRNPIVEQVVLETLRVVRDIWLKHGDFKEIHVELGREMKNPADKRKRISSRNTENENTNIRIKELLNEILNDQNTEGEVRPYSPSHQEILKIYEEGVFQNPKANFDKVSEDEILKIRKNSSPSKKDIERYKLWLEQGYISPYTGKPIQLSKLFTSAYQIEHIIPQSRYFDNSLGNKIICESDVNEDKDNKTAYEYLKEKGGQTINGHKLFTLSEYEDHVSKYFKKNTTKLKNLLSEEIPEGFINRQMNDSRYISKLVKSLLSNIVREEGEDAATSKNLITTPGAITSKLKQDWGLNDKWNELIAPRFERLNRITDSNDFGYWDNTINAFRIQVPDEISRGFSKKRIDHRHHALDALVIACTTRDHVHYLNSLNSEKKNYSLRDKLLIKNKHKDYTKHFHLPWASFPQEAKNKLETMVVSFKQNLRVINKTNNKFWSYRDENGKLNIGKDGKPKKLLRKQTKGDSWAIRKPMHEETVSGIVNLPWVKLGKKEITTATRERNDLVSLFKDIKAKNKAEAKDKAEAKISKITDTGIQKILINYLISKDNNPELAFSPEGIEDMNKNISNFNDGKFHHPIFKVRTYEKGKGRFILGTTGNNKSKYVQGAPNLFYAIYWDGVKGKRVFETIPLNIVIERLKQDLSPVPEINENGLKLIFHLSPDDLIYVPTVDETENINLLDLNNFTKEQKERIYFVNDFSGSTCYFRPNPIAKAIRPKEVDLSFNKTKNKLTGSFDIKTASLEGLSIKDCCIKLKLDRLGNITKVIK